MKICVCITARASYARIKAFLLALRSDPFFEIEIVLAGSTNLERYGKVSTLIEDDKFPISHQVIGHVEGDSFRACIKTVALHQLELGDVLERLRPDAVVTIADRFETIATAIAASYQNIPLIHFQGGEFTGSIDDKVRNAVSALADLHLVSTERARERLLRSGEDLDSVFATGCPSVDLAAQSIAERSADISEVNDLGVGWKFKTGSTFCILLQHSVTWHADKAGDEVMNTLRAVIRAGIPCLCIWPNSDPGNGEMAHVLRRHRETSEGQLMVRFVKNLPAPLFYRLLEKSAFLVGNSSVGIRECSYIGTPVVNIGDRQLGRDRSANVLDCDDDEEAIFKAIQFQINRGSYARDFLYGEGLASVKAVEVVKNWVPKIKRYGGKL